MLIIYFEIKFVFCLLKVSAIVNTVILLKKISISTSSNKLGISDLIFL